MTVSRLPKWHQSSTSTPMWRAIISTSWHRVVMLMWRSFAHQAAELVGHQSVIQQRLNYP